MICENPIWLPNQLVWANEIFVSIAKFAGPLALWRVRSAPGPQGPEACWSLDHLSFFEVIYFTKSFTDVHYYHDFNIILKMIEN